MIQEKYIPLFIDYIKSKYIYRGYNKGFIFLRIVKYGTQLSINPTAVKKGSIKARHIAYEFMIKLHDDKVSILNPKKLERIKLKLAKSLRRKPNYENFIVIPKAKENPPVKISKKKSEYQAYIDSSEWRSKSRSCIELAGFICEACCKPGILQAHHYSYINFKKETHNDLFCLCKDCHIHYHKIRKSNQLPRDTNLPRIERLKHIKEVIFESRKKHKTTTH